MKNLKPLTVALSVLSLLMAPIALAQPGSWDRCCGDWGIGEHYPQMYDPTTVETIQGSVISVDTFTPMLGMRGGVHLSVETEAGVVSVHLGPSWYLDEQEMQITEGDNIEVTGSKVTFSGEPVIIAATVRNGDRVLTLRDENGVPMWQGWNRQQP